MASETKISWAHSTLNFWIGCTAVSAACDHCYAEREWADRKHRVVWGPHGNRSRTKTWSQAYQWNRAHDVFFAAHGCRRRVFVNSLSDFCDNHPSIEPAWREEAWKIIRECQNLDFIILTKRPQLFMRFAPADFNAETFPNVWAGTTVENQAEAERRIPHLIEIPAAIRLLSMEPLLEEVDISQWLYPFTPCPDCPCPDPDRDRTRLAECCHEPELGKSPIHWVLVGGESGPGARHMHPEWARFLRDSCNGAGVAFHMKQLSQADHPRTFKDFDTFPPDLRVREVPA